MSLRSSPFTVNHLPYVRRNIPGLVKDIQLIRAFAVRPMEQLKSRSENGVLPLKKSLWLETAAKKLDSTVEQLKSVGFNSQGLDVVKFMSSFDDGTVLPVKLRHSEKLTFETYSSAVVGRVCDPQIVLHDFDIRTVLRRHDLADYDKAILTKSYIRHLLKAGEAQSVSVTEAGKFVSDIACDFSTRTRFKTPKPYCEQWFFIHLMANVLFPNDKRQQEMLMTVALNSLIHETEAKYTVEDAASWITSMEKDFLS